VNWAACVDGPDVRAFSIRPGYDPQVSLRSLSGGYVVKPDVSDPYHDKPEDVWLVQKALFESTYDFLPE